MCSFEFFPIFPWLWKKTKKTDGKIEKKTRFFPSLQNTSFTRKIIKSHINAKIHDATLLFLKIEKTRSRLKLKPYLCRALTEVAREIGGSTP